MKVDVNKLLVAMARMGLSLTELARRSNVSRATISYIKNGKSCRPDMIYKIASALNVDVDEIIMTKGNGDN